jgi:hypothetical protein
VSYCRTQKTKSPTTDFDHPRLKVAATAEQVEEAASSKPQNKQNNNRHTLFSIFEFCLLAFFRSFLRKTGNCLFVDKTSTTHFIEKTKTMKFFFL